jgi:superfamily II DNA/RNA helicase
MEFKDLGLSDAVLRAVEDAGYKIPTPIQEQAIPAVQMCRDVLGLAQTGTGKTGAFTIPMIDALASGRAKARMPRSLILTPTRELAAQISENFIKYGKYHPLTMALIVGGTSMDEQIGKLDKGVDVLIATPGRLLDLFGRGKILLADIKILVIDEADRMMDMGFIPDLEKISSILPPVRQTLFFSATMPPEIKKLSEKFLSNPKVITVSPPSSTSTNVEQFLIHVPHSRAKQGAFWQLFQKEDVKNGFVFCNRKRDINDVCKFMKSKGIKAGQLHGDMDQSSRTDTLSRFKAGETDILVCSDVAARGLDVQGMSHVFNWDVPFHSEDYVHRIGRTGRAGAKGRAFTFAVPDDFKNLGFIEKLIGKKIPIFEGVSPPEGSENLPEWQGSGGGERPARGRQDRGRESEARRKKIDSGENVAQRERHHNRREKTDHNSGGRQRNHPDIESEANSGGFGDDVPSFLQRK